MKKQGLRKQTVWEAFRGLSVLVTSIRIDKVICFKQRRADGEKEGEEELIESHRMESQIVRSYNDLLSLVLGSNCYL